MDQYDSQPGIFPEREFFISMRITKQALIKKRNSKASVFLVTGGTGFIGSHIAVELLKRGYRVILVCRPGKNLSAQERVEQLLAWFQLNGKKEVSRLEVIEGFIDRPNFGLTLLEYERLSGRIDEIVHCAANTTFSGKKQDEVETANVKSLENLLAMASAPPQRCYFFHHISTAYVAGKRTGICPEQLVDTQEFYNIYEETKYRAERYVWEKFPSQGIRVNIYRPSIVYGHSKTGKSLRFNALYFPMKTALFLKRVYEKDIKENQGRKALQMGVKMEKDGTMFLPIRMEKKEGGSINLIPIDFFIDAFLTIMEESLAGDIFHIVSSRPKCLEDLIDYGQEMFKIKGFRTVDKESFEREPVNGLEVLFNSYLDVYQPYLRDTRQFDSKKTETILKKRNMSCPDFNFEVFTRCMEYALEVDWGKRPHGMGDL
jgi:nucleoside-diphosphate-sugar epimerase